MRRSVAFFPHDRDTRDHPQRSFLDYPLPSARELPVTAAVAGAVEDALRGLGVRVNACH
jgi:hypothetical protein